MNATAFLTLAITLFAALPCHGCKPHVEVSDAGSVSLAACERYRLKHTRDDEYLTMTVIRPSGRMPDARSRSYLLTWKLIGGDAFRLDHASKGAMLDVAPMGDTRMTMRDGTLCLAAGPGDSSTDPCLATWLKHARDGAHCLTPE